MPSPQQLIFIYCCCGDCTKTHILSFMAKLVGAKVALRFSKHKLDFISGKLED